MKLLVVLTAITCALGQQRLVPTLDGRIVGGTDASIADHPYQISLQLFSSHICGGAIISDNWIITAGHCVEDVPIPSLLSVRVGSSLRNSGGEVHSVVFIISHQNYSRATLDFDIALLQLSSRIPTTIVSRSIPLPSPGAGPAANSTAIITGWGTLSEDGPLATVLQMVQVPVISQQDCQNAYATYTITERMFCAGLLGVGGRDACQGDSGGPLTVNGVLVGLVSWGIGCARPDSPGVYTNLAVLRAWIATNSGV